MAKKRSNKKTVKSRAKQSTPPQKHTPINNGVNAVLHPPNSQRSSNLQQVHHQKIEAFHGPIPPPETLKEYNNLDPGFAVRILEMAEREQKHRQKCEDDALQQNIKNHKARNTERARGQYLGFTIGSTAIICGTYLAANGFEWAGGFLGTGGVIGLVAVFVIGHKLQPKKNEADKP